MVSVTLVFAGLLIAIVGSLFAARPGTMVYVREWPTVERESIEVTDTGRLVWLAIGSVFASIGLAVIVYGLTV